VGGEGGDAGDPKEIHELGKISFLLPDQIVFPLGHISALLSRSISLGFRLFIV
jgi:F0F1-type ATP synthase membrane subunit a